MEKLTVYHWLSLSLYNIHWYNTVEPKIMTNKQHIIIRKANALKKNNSNICIFSARWLPKNATSKKNLNKTQICVMKIIEKSFCFISHSILLLMHFPSDLFLTFFWYAGKIGLAWTSHLTTSKSLNRFNNKIISTHQRQSSSYNNLLLV